jgi:putative membrane protein
MENNTVKPAKKKKVGSWLVRLIQGAIIGVGGIIPGISGGVLCAVFGLYEPLMETLAHPIKGLKKNFKLLLPVVIGIGVGFVALAKVVELLFESNAEIATALFVGLILGELPSLWKEAGEQGKRRASSYICMTVAFVLLFSALLVIELGTEMKIAPNPVWYGICGLFLGLGVVIPGMSGSAPLTFLGLYEPLMGVISGVAEAGIGILGGKLSLSAGIGAMSLQNVIPVGVGILIPFLVISRPIHFCIKKFPSQMYHTIFGVVLATTLPTLIFKIGFGELPIVKVGFIILGFICAWLVDLLSRKYT